MNSIVTSSYAIHFNQRAYDAINVHLAEKAYSKIFILVDENTKQHCLSSFVERLPSGLVFDVLEIVSGEIQKNIQTCTKVWQSLSDFDADRKSLLINLGGGVITDLGGFVASTFKRGIAFINVPTTLLAMVDASVGGKTGVDLGPLKNQVGVINQPEMVLIVTEFLNTLEERQRKSGFAEMLKHGLIQSAPYWDALKEISEIGHVDEQIYESVTIKNRIVLQDPTEQNLRKILNFGHTLGHAIESYFLESTSHETLLHGEAIAVGMVLEAYLSHKISGLTDSDLADINSIFGKRYQKISMTDTDIETILSFLKFDKKNSHGNINFVLLKNIGEPVIDIKISDEMIKQAFAYYAQS